MAKNYRLIVQNALREIAIEDGGDGIYRASFGGVEYSLELEALDDNTLFRLWVDGRSTPVAIKREGAQLDLYIGPDHYSAEIERSAGSLTAAGPALAGEVRMTAPMTGQVTEVLVGEGDRVEEGDPLLVIVAMKMNNEIRSPLDGVIAQVAVSPAAAVDQGDLILVINASAEPR